MRVETTEPKIKAVEYLGDGKWAVRWDLKPKYDEEGKPIENSYWYEEYLYHHIPQIEHIKELITNWFNKQIDGAILHGHRFKGMKVLLSAENQANFKALFDRALQIEEDIKKWDIANPDLAGKTTVPHTITKQDGTTEEIHMPTGRPISLFPITFKLGDKETPNFYTFETIEELTSFYDSGLMYIQGCYQSGWTKLAQFDWSVYEEAIAEL